MAVRVGFGPSGLIDTSQVIDFNKREKRSNRSFPGFEVHGGYMDNELISCNGLVVTRYKVFGRPTGNFSSPLPESTSANGLTHATRLFTFSRIKLSSAARPDFRTAARAARRIGFRDFGQLAQLAKETFMSAPPTSITRRR